MVKLTMTGCVFHVDDDGMTVYTGPHGVLKALPCKACGSRKAPNVFVETAMNHLSWSAGKCDCGAPANVVYTPVTTATSATRPQTDSAAP